MYLNNEQKTIDLGHVTQYQTEVNCMVVLDARHKVLSKLNRDTVAANVELQ